MPLRLAKRKDMVLIAITLPISKPIQIITLELVQPSLETKYHAKMDGQGVQQSPALYADLEFMLPLVFYY